MKVIRALPSVIVLAAFMLVISSTLCSRAEIDSMMVTIARTDDEGIVREIRTNGYIPKNSENRNKGDRCLVVIHGKGRSAQEYFEDQKPLADKYRAFLIVPEFEMRAGLTQDTSTGATS